MTEINLFELALGFIMGFFATIMAEFFLGFIGKIKMYIGIRRYFLKFWKNFKTKTIWVVPPNDIDNIIQGTQSNDHNGILEIQKLFTMEKFDVSMVYSDNVGAALKDNNLICVAGPIPNEITRTLLSRSEIVYNFGSGNSNEGHLIMKKGSVFPLPDLYQNNSQSEIVRDYGIITRMKNPYCSDNKEIIIASGCFGYGTEAALLLLGKKESLNYLKDIEGPFQILCTCEVDHRKKIGYNHEIVDCTKNDSIRQKTLELLNQ